MNVTKPGLYGMPAEDYHADPVLAGSLSSSGARKLLPPSCPALFRYELDNPPPPTEVFSIGHAAHKLVLGAGPELAVVDRERWDTKESKAEVAAIRERGGVPLKKAVFEQVHAMAEAIHNHPVASALFRPGTGDAEQSAFWIDRPSGIWRRCRFDWLPKASDGRMIIPDYKSTKSADPEKLQRTILDYGYHQQAAWYLDGARELGLAGDDAVFLFVFQEKTPPYLVTVAEPDINALRIGRVLNRTAIDIYTECVATGRWPGYSDDVELISLPVWAENRYLEEIA